MDNKLNVYFGDKYAQQSGPGITLLGNEDASWEISRKFNAGMDLNMFDNSLSIIVDAFNENRSGIFMQRVSLPSSMGYTGETSYGNIGKVRNYGVDGSLEYNRAFGKDLIVSVRGTFTYAHNETVFRDEARGTAPYMLRKGQPIYSLWGLVADGLFASPGGDRQQPRADLFRHGAPGRHQIPRSERRRRDRRPTTRPRSAARRSPKSSTASAPTSSTKNSTSRSSSRARGATESR